MKNYYNLIYDKLIKTNDDYMNYALNLNHSSRRRLKEKILKFNIEIPRTYIIGPELLPSSILSVEPTDKDEEDLYRSGSLEVIRYYGKIPRVLIPFNFAETNRKLFLESCLNSLRDWLFELPKLISENKQRFLIASPTYRLYYRPKEILTFPMFGRDTWWKGGNVRIPLFPLNIYACYERLL